MSVWNVYIDETYFDNIQQARIITSFFAIDANESKEVIEKYQKKIIKKAKKEVKSLRASNNKIIDALKIASNYNHIYLVNNSNDYHYADGYSEEIKMAGVIEAYAYPLKRILQLIRSKSPNDHEIFELRVFVDQQTYLSSREQLIEIFKFLIKDFLDEQDFIGTYSVKFVDSKKYIGVQIADMLAGAARRKLLTNASVLYYSIDNEYDCRKDESFLKCFGLLNLWREQCVQDSKSLSFLQKKITFLTREIEKIVYNEASLYYVTPIINSARLLNKTLSKDFKNFQILGRKIGSEKKRRNFFIIFLNNLTKARQNVDKIQVSNVKTAMDQIEQLMDKIAERKLYLNDKNLEQSIWILLDNLNLLKLFLVTETDYGQFFIKLRKLNEKFKGISKPYHHISKKTHTVNQMRRAINAVIANIIDANNLKLKDLQDDQIIQIYVEASALNQNWLKLTGNEGVRYRKHKNQSEFIQLSLDI